MVTVAEPTVAALEAVSVNVLVVVALAGVNEAVTPNGRPLAVSATDPVKPPVLARVTVLVPLAPWAMLRLAGETDKE